MTRLTLRALAAAVALALPFLGPAPARAQTPDPLPPAPGLVLELVDRGNGWAQYQWRDPASGGVYDLGPERRIHEAPVRVPGVPIPAVYGEESPIEHGIRAGLPRAWAYRVAACESGGDPSARNRRSGAMGLYQFLPGTFAATPQGRAGLNPYDPYVNAEAAAWLYRTYGPGQWSCK